MWKLAKVSKKRKRLKQLTRAGVPCRELLHFYTAVIRPVLEYATPVWPETDVLPLCHATNSHYASSVVDIINVDRLVSARSNLQRGPRE